MKNYDTEIFRKRNVVLEEIKDILYSFRNEDDEHFWICVFDTSKKNPSYVQATLIDEDFVKEAAQYINEHFNIETSDEIPYLFEARFYHGTDFTYYRAYFPEASYIYDIFKKYLNDELISTDNWLDVTEEMIKD